jgi:hypothetical protein
MTRGLTAADGRVTKLSLVTDLPFGRNEEASVWIASGNGAVLQGEKLVTGRRPYWKLWRHGVESFIQWRAEPLRAERDLPVERWSKKKVTTRAIPALPGQGAVVTDPYALIYLVSAAGLGAIGERMTLHVLSRDRLVEVDFRADRLVQAEVRFEQSFGKRTVHRSGQVAAIKVVGTGRYVGQDEVVEDVDTGFMGMQGGLTILLESGTGLPLLISGRSGGLGEIKVKLATARMAR